MKILTDYEITSRANRNAKNHAECYYYIDSKERQKQAELDYKAGFVSAMYMRHENELNIISENETLKSTIKSLRISAIISSVIIMILCAIIMMLAYFAT